MVTDSILSVIILKWAVINDVSVPRVLQASGWMTSALRFKKSPLSAQSLRCCDRVLWISCFSLSLTHTCVQREREREKRSAGNKSPCAKHMLTLYNPFVLILPSMWSRNTCVRSFISVSKHEMRSGSYLRGQNRLLKNKTGRTEYQIPVYVCRELIKFPIF